MTYTNAPCVTRLIFLMSVLFFLGGFLGAFSLQCVAANPDLNAEVQNVLGKLKLQYRVSASRILQRVIEHFTSDHPEKDTIEVQIEQIHDAFAVSVVREHADSYDCDYADKLFTIQDGEVIYINLKFSTILGCGCCYGDCSIENFDREFLKDLSAFSSARTLTLPDATFDSVGVEHLSHLTDLESIEFLGSKITTEAFTHLGKLKNLKTVTFRGSHLTDDDFQTIAQWSKLEKIFILSYANSIPMRTRGFTKQGLAALSKLAGLKELFIDYPDLDQESLDIFSSFPALQTLNINSAILNDDSFRISEMPKLKHLSVSFSSTDLSRKERKSQVVSVEKLPFLTSLKFSIYGIFQPQVTISDLPALRYLETTFSGYGLIPGGQMSLVIEDLPSLKKFSTGNSYPTSDFTVRNCRTLEQFSLSQSGSMNEISVVNCPALRSMDFSASNVDVDNVSFSDCPNLATLNYRTPLPKIRRLDVRGTKISEDYLSAVQKLLPRIAILSGAASKE